MRRGEKQRFEVPGKLPGLNEYTKQNRRNPYIGAAAKRGAQEGIMWAIKAARLKPMKAPVHIHITWVEPDMRRDKDNIRFAAKFVLDALVEMGVIQNDNWKWIGGSEDVGLSDSYRVNAKNPRVIVEITQL